MIHFVPLSKDVALIRFGEQVQLSSVQRLVGQVRSHLAAAPKPAAYVADCRAVQIFSPDVADALISLMKADNPMIERTGVVVTPGAVFSMQVERMLREAGNPARRTFGALEQALRWLSEVATDQQCELIRSHCELPLSAGDSPD